MIIVTLENTALTISTVSMTFDLKCTLKLRMKVQFLKYIKDAFKKNWTSKLSWEDSRAAIGQIANLHITNTEVTFSVKMFCLGSTGVGREGRTIVIFKVIIG